MRAYVLSAAERAEAAVVVSDVATDVATEAPNVETVSVL